MRKHAYPLKLVSCGTWDCTTEGTTLAALLHMGWSNTRSGDTGCRITLPATSPDSGTSMLAKLKINTGSCYLHIAQMWRNLKEEHNIKISLHDTIIFGLISWRGPLSPMFPHVQVHSPSCAAALSRFAWSSFDREWLISMLLD